MRLYNPLFGEEMPEELMKSLEKRKDNRLGIESKYKDGWQGDFDIYAEFELNALKSNGFIREIQKKDPNMEIIANSLRASLKFLVIGEEGKTEEPVTIEYVDPYNEVIRETPAILEEDIPSMENNGAVGGRTVHFGGVEYQIGVDPH